MSAGRPVMAALAALPRREHLLEPVLKSLRPQVDRLCVFLNGWHKVPDAVRQLADDHVLSFENLGAEKKLHWASGWDGLYCSTDDDLLYPPDYVARMRQAIELTGGRALVTVHGRVYIGHPETVHNVAPQGLGFYDRNVSCDRPVNHGGTGVMAWDARVIKVPAEFPERNMADLQLAVWAQQQRVPMWLLRHEAKWVKPLAYCDPDGLFRSSQRAGHSRRNSLLRQHGRAHGWKLFECPTSFAGTSSTNC